MMIPFRGFQTPSFMRRGPYNFVSGMYDRAVYYPMTSYETPIRLDDVEIRMFYGHIIVHFPTSRCKSFKRVEY